MKQKLSFLIIITMLLSVWTNAVTFADDDVFFKETYENYEIGTKPDYGFNGWDGDSANVNSYAEILQLEDGNKAFCLHSTGDGEVKSRDMLVYKTLKMDYGDDRTFQTKVMTQDANGSKIFFIRKIDGDKYELLKLAQGEKLYICGAAKGEYKVGEWLDVKFYFDNTEQTCKIYIDGKLQAIADLSNADILTHGASLRATIIGSNVMDEKTTLFLDDTAFGKNFVDLKKENSEQPNSGAGSLIMCIDSSKVKIDDMKMSMSDDNSIRPRKIDSKFYIPLRFTAEKFGYSVSYDAETNSAAVSDGNGKILFSQNSDSAEKNGNKVIMNAPTLNIDSTLYIPLSSVSELFGLHTLSSDYGGIVVQKENIMMDANDLTSVLPSIIYERPTPDRIISDLNSFKGSRPRIFLNKERIEEIKSDVVNNENIKEWYAVNVKQVAEESLTIPVYKYELRDGIRLLYVCNDVQKLVLACGLAYLVEGDTRYADRIVEELVNAAKYPDWNPSHFLDVAEMTFSFAMGYDWLYDYLSESQKQILREAIVTHGLKAGMEAYDGTAYVDKNVTGGYHNRMGWKEDKSNWSFVCNGGLTAGALAIMDDYETELCADIISRAIKSIEYPISILAPDGVWEEGVGYWSYGISYMIRMYSSLENTLGTSYSLLYAPGVINTGYFPIYNTGPCGTFNVGDAGQGVLNSPSFFWFASRFNDAGLGNTRLKLMEQYDLPAKIEDVFFYKPMEGGETHLNKDSYMMVMENANMRSGWGNLDATYVGFHGGKNNVSHGDLDLGSFVFDAIGERWAVDLGLEEYNLPGYWGWPTRAEYYRKRAEGHNTLVMNPDGEIDQNPNAGGVLLDFRSGEYGGYIVDDISSAYADKNVSAKRAVAIYDDRTKVSVTDEITAENETDVYWCMQTPANIDINEDGKGAVLTIGNKHVLMLVDSDSDNTVITYGKAEPLPTSPKGEGQTENEGINRIIIRTDKVKKLNMQVRFIPYYDGEAPDITESPFTTVKNISKFDLNRQNMADISELKVNGKPVPNFTSTQSIYRMEAGSNIETDIIEYTSDYEVTVVKEEKRVKLIVTDKTGSLRSRTYYLSY